MPHTLQQVYRLPGHLTAYACQYVTTFCENVKNSIADRIVIDASELKIVDPFGLCLTAVTLQRLSAERENVTVRDIPHYQLRYLASMDFFVRAGIEMRGIGGRQSSRERSEDLMELRQVNEERDVDRVSRQLAEITVGRIPGISKNDQPDEMTGYTESDRLIKPLQYVFIELLQNSLTHGRKHSRSVSGAWIACRYDRIKDRLNLSIVDQGCGLRESLRGHPQLRDNSDLAAIEAAVLPRVSSNRSVGLRLPGHESENEGIGLTICRDIALKSKGVLHMVTGSAHAMFQKRAIHDRAREICSWDGTAVAIELDRAALRTLKIHELFGPYREPISGTKPRFT